MMFYNKKKFKYRKLTGKEKTVQKTNTKSVDIKKMFYFDRLEQACCCNMEIKTGDKMIMCQ